jgi:hypothetical protein
MNTVTRQTLLWFQRPNDGLWNAPCACGATLAGEEYPSSSVENRHFSRTHKERLDGKNYPECGPDEKACKDQYTHAAFVGLMQCMNYLKSHKVPFKHTPEGLSTQRNIIIVGGSKLTDGGGLGCWEHFFFFTREPQGVWVTTSPMRVNGETYDDLDVRVPNLRDAAEFLVKTYRKRGLLQE